MLLKVTFDVVNGALLSIAVWLVVNFRRRRGSAFSVFFYYGSDVCVLVLNTPIASLSFFME